MGNKKISKLESFFINFKNNKKIINFIIVILFVVIIDILVYQTGGVKFVYSHTMYIPILYAGIFLGAKWGLIFGIISGILLGPLMPIDTLTMEKQTEFNWLFRLFMFCAIGFISGLFSDILNNNIKKIKRLYSYNFETEIPNMNIFTNKEDFRLNLDKQIIISILVNNYDTIIDILGLNVYNRVVRQVYINLKNKLSNDAIIVQPDSTKLWISIKYTNTYNDVIEVLNILNQPLEIDNVPIYIEYSIGVHYADNQQVAMNVASYKESDIAARYAQKNNLQYAVYNNKLKLNNYDISLLGSLSKALEENQTFLVYQPKYDLNNNKIIGFEALIRWNHPTRGIIPPDEFIPMIEETQLIHQLTDWVIKKVIRKIKEFKELGIDIHISINVSAKNLLDHGFCNRVNNIINSANISPKQIEFEITESTLLTNTKISKNVLNKLSEDGYIISLDDFGKGYSSLIYLGQFQFHILKLDQYFMKEILKNESIKHIVKSTIDLAHKLGYKVVAEGVEDSNTAKLAQNFNCDYAQGYYFEKPIKDIDVLNWYQNVH